jgi:hypothetical protein
MIISGFALGWFASALAIRLSALGSPAYKAEKIKVRAIKNLWFAVKPLNNLSSDLAISSSHLTSAPFRSLSILI